MGKVESIARKTDTWEIRVFIMGCNSRALEFQVKWPPHGRGPNGGEQREILAEVLEHRDRLLEEWEKKVVVREEM